MLFGLSAYLYLNLFLVTNVPILLSGDQVYFWMNGQRMLYGEHPYVANWQALPRLLVASEYGRHFLVYAILPMSYLLVLKRCYRGRFTENFRKVALLGLVGSCLLGQLVFSLNWLRLYAVCMAGIVLFVWVISTSTRFRRYGLISIWALVLLLGFFQATWPGMYIPLGLRNPVFLDTASTMLNPQWAERAV
jgi:hypothetical protein